MPLRLFQSHIIHPESMQWEIAELYKKKGEKCIRKFLGLG